METVKITITEALAELKLIPKKVEKQKKFILDHLTRPAAMRDVLENEGGCQKMIGTKLQSISDLEDRFICIRRAIQNANDNTEVTVAGITMTINEWLIMKREILPAKVAFWNNLYKKVQMKQQEAQQRGLVVTEKESETDQRSIVVNMSQTRLMEEVEQMEEIIGKLDGLLSLKNARVEIEI